MEKMDCRCILYAFTMTKRAIVPPPPRLSCSHSSHERLGVSRSVPRIGRTVHFLSVFAGHTQVAQQLINNGAELNLTDKNSQSALHLASFYDKPEMVTLLVRAGCDPGLPDSQGQRPITVAREMGNADIVQLLLKYDSYKPKPVHPGDIALEPLKEGGKTGPGVQGKKSAGPGVPSQDRNGDSAVGADAVNPEGRTCIGGEDAADGGVGRKKGRERHGAKDNSKKTCLCCVVS